MEGKPTTTKRKIEELEHIMDMYYKQENDALLVENRQLAAENKKLKRSLALKTHILEINASRLREMEAQRNWARLMMEEIFARFPIVAATYEQELETEEEILTSDEE